MAARGACAAAGKVANYRLFGREHGFGLAPWTRRFCAATERTRLDRGAHRRDRVSLGGGSHRAFAEIAADFVRLKVDVIVTVEPAQSRGEAGDIGHPIVFAIASDPVRDGLVASLARPGGNVTGLSNQTVRSCGQAARAFARSCPRSASTGDFGKRRQSRPCLEMGEVEVAARRARTRSRSQLEIRRAEDIAPAFEAQQRPSGRALCGGRPTRYHQPARALPLCRWPRGCQPFTILAITSKPGG